jgi:hypothetical protein
MFAQVHDGLISRDVEDPMAGLGVVAFYETVR